MEIFAETIERELPDLVEQGVRVRFIGRRDRAPGRSCASGWRRSRSETWHNERLSLWIAFDYGGRDELVAGGAAARRVGDRPPTRSTRTRFAAQLYAPELPDPDLLIRTSGELRISNFLLWQLAYSELVFVETLWPDFGAAELRDALAAQRAPAAYASAGGRRCHVDGLPRAPVDAETSLSRLARRRRSACRSCSGWSGSAAGGCSSLATVVGLLALHEYYAMTRPLRPIVIAGYLGLDPDPARRPGGRLRVDRRRAGDDVRARIPAQGRGGHEAVGDGCGGRDGARRGLDRARARVHPAAPRPARATAGWRPSPLLLAVWAGDTAAFFVGRLVGRHKLAPRISPGKTWEGFVAGTAATIFVTFVALYDDRREFLSIGQSLPPRPRDRRRGAARRPVRVAAQARHGREGHAAGVLGGHGGVLDRIDAPLFASIAALLRHPRLRQGL